MAAKRVEDLELDLMIAFAIMVAAIVTAMRAWLVTIMRDVRDALDARYGRIKIKHIHQL